MGFGAQFTSVILILLTFIIGAFLRPIPKEVDVKELAIEEIVAPIGAKSYSNLFLKEQAVLNQDQAEALKTFLLQHDVFANISLYEAEASLLLARSVVLQRFLEDLRLPPEARKVYTYLQTKKIQAKVVFTFTENSDGLI